MKSSTDSPLSTETQHHLGRRGALKGAAGLVAAGLASAGLANAAPPDVKKRKPKVIGVKKGRINQSVVSWCFSKYWNTEEMCGAAKKLGCKSIELIDPKEWPTLKKHGLTCAISPIPVEGPPFIKGFNNPKYHDMVIEATRKAIDASADFGCPNVISFTGYAEDMTSEQGAKNCVAGYKKIIGHAEKKGVNLCLEMLNTRDDSDPNKGHPGYQGDHVDYCIDIIKKVGSPRMKLLFDIYHVQIMDGDVIRRIGECGEHIGHVHTAGNPGRGELDKNQEIYYPPIMEALLKIKYKGFVGQEFIPTRDPFKGLSQAVSLCDV
jgi:hydroxypyruvate isomerase|tara:strand:+ start:2349 stop:3308 length:960 start_codon:yes stop_codon:yes gene_type:complete